MENISIIPIGLSQLDELQTIGKETFYTAFKDQNTEEDMEKYLEFAFAKANLAQQLTNPDCHFFFAEYSGNTIGYLKLNTGPAQNELREEQGMELERIYTISNFQGKGVGSLVLNFAETYGTELQKDYIWLGVWEKNPAAIRLYERKGYVQFDTHIYIIGNDPQTDHLMRKKLAP